MTCGWKNENVIISVGYRVKSKRDTQFRIWANKILKDYLLKSYALNRRRLKEQTECIKEIEKTLEIFSNVAEKYSLQKDEPTSKNNSFLDGSKRIAAAIFLWFLEENRILFNSAGQKRMADNAPIALSLMLAESDSKEKEMIVKVVVNLINKNNP